MPKVRDSSGTIGTTCLPIFLSRSSVFSIRTNAIVVEISRSPVGLSWAPKAESSGTASARALPPRRKRPAERGSPLAQVALLGAACGQLQERHLVDVVVGEGDVEAVAESPQLLLRHLLLLVRDVLALAGLAHAVALDGLGEDHGGRPALSTAAVYAA